MKELERLIRDLRKQLLPYHHDHDIESGMKRWDVAEGDYLTSWIARHLGMCLERNRCNKRKRCVFYDYGDLAKRNYEICSELILRLENGSVECRFTEEERAEGDSEAEETCHNQPEWQICQCWLPEEDTGQQPRWLWASNTMINNKLRVRYSCAQWHGY